MSETEPGTQSDGAAAHIIEVQDVTKTYEMGEVRVEALRGVSLIIDACDFLVITGRNGSGKSTLLHQLGLLDLPTSGKIFVNGEEVTAMHEKKRSLLRLKQLGYIFQEFALVDELTALENVMLPAMMMEFAGKCRDRARGLLELVGLEGLEGHLPNQLSGGEQQKVAIARALINNPMVVFADEPTANLDSVAALDVLNLFTRLNRDEGHTVVMITHEREETEFGNRVIKLADGVMVDAD